MQYWFFYYFNEFNDLHEGDWEGMQVTFDASSPQQALSRAPDQIALFQHGGGEKASWHDAKVETEGRHPVVYVAAGSHATFFQSAVYVENGGGPGASKHIFSIIDTKSFQHIGDVAGLPGNSNEGMIVDHAGKNLYVNLTGTDEVGVIDMESGRLVSRWALPNAHVAHAIALDEPDHRLFVATRNPARFIVFNTDTTKVVSSLPCVSVNSDMWFDISRKRIYVTGSEMASVFSQRDANHYEHLAEVPTAYRAKSSIFVPELNRLYIAASGKGKPDAKLKLLIYKVQ